MQLDELYPLTGFTLTQIVKTPSGKVLLKAVSASRSAVCPYCQTLSKKRHSIYIRKPQALPCSDTAVQLILEVPRYFCHNPACHHATFAERIPETAHFYSRRTIQLESLLKTLAFEISAETATRVCDKLKVTVSPDGLLRLIRKMDPLSAPTVRVLGETGAPQAIQVIDRWHLLHNLQENLQEIIPNQLKRQKSEAEKKEMASSQKRKKQFELVKYLHARGYSQRLIGRLLGISRGTVRRYIEDAELPNWQPRKPSPSKLDIYRTYLQTRWKDGCQDVSLLWKELQQKGYNGQRKSVAEYLQRFRTHSSFHSARQMENSRLDKLLYELDAGIRSRTLPQDA